MTLASALKVHLRVHEIHGTMLRVVTLRPQTPAQFSTNYFHDTWHILAGNDGAAVLGRLLWGLAFQRHAGTLLLIDEPHLVPTPFEADPPDPIVIVPDGLTSVDDDALRALRLRLRRAPGSPTTIRWHTFGMPAALERNHGEQRWRGDLLRSQRSRERMSRRAGFVCFTAPPDILRDHALGIYGMRAWDTWGAYHPLAEHGAHGSWGYDGEFQLVPGFADAVSAARVARREVLGRDAGPLTNDDDRRAIYRGKDRAADRLDAARRAPRAPRR
jgi:hypothetical protein